MRRRISLVARATSLGADVIKVEATEGEVGRRVGPFITSEGSRVSFLHATKRSLTLDLRTPAGRVVFLKLAARSDIVVQNFRPGTFDKWGIGYEHCRVIKPDIVYVSMSGYGHTGRHHHYTTFGPVAQAVSGLT
ncbi:MAG: hypothetical protein QOK03_2259, partial [Candidatus Binataceae bacterium]|nr:hypothetical protein [Candidatus Binataceae bacterium]